MNSFPHKLGGAVKCGISPHQILCRLPRGLRFSSKVLTFAYLAILQIEYLNCEFKHRRLLSKRMHTNQLPQHATTLGGAHYFNSTKSLFVVDPHFRTGFICKAVTEEREEHKSTPGLKVDPFFCRLCWIESVLSSSAGPRCAGLE